jgi:hypothetical protein
MSSYIVDTNFFIQSYRGHYPLDVAITFWARVKELAANGTIISIDKVKDEIYKKEDDLKNWCLANLPDSFFDSTATVLPDYGRIMTWAASMTSQYTPAAITEFMSIDEADPWLVACAITKNIPIVTYETSQPARKNKIKIPEVCTEFGPKFMTPIEMFKELGISF